MNRRVFLRRGGILASASAVARLPVSLLGSTASPLQHFKMAVISDGLSQDFETALQIMKSYGISWVEIRNVWGKYNTEATPEQIQRLRALLEKYELRCSLVDTALFKCKLPGTQTQNERKDIYPYSQQTDLLKRAIERAHAWGTDKVRIFTFWRVAEPEKIAGRIIEEVQKAAEVTRAAGMRLLIEDEDACNVGTGHELATLLNNLPPNVGANWDIGNGLWLGEVSYPDEYKSLDPNRIWNLHVKGVQCGPGLKDCRETFVDQGQIDLDGQLRALLKNGYQGTVSLECEFKPPELTQTETTKRSIEGLLKVMSSAIT
jgi:L-ribulose-5-phosphate 3-epimerase